MHFPADRSLTHLIVTSLLFASLSGCHSAKPKLAERSLEGTDFAFKSGLRVFVQPEPTAKAITSTLYIGAGSAEEPKGKEGLAHVVEHMLFRARHIPKQPDTVMDLFDRLGVQMNAYTSQDETVYLEVASPELLPAILQIAQARLLNPLARVTDEDFATEREVVRSELRQGLEGGGFNEQYGKFFRWIFQNAFPEGHPYHHMVIGTHESLSSLTLDDVRTFVKKNYRIDNATLVLVGDIDMEDVRKLMMNVWSAELMTPNGKLRGGEKPLLSELPPARLQGEAAVPPPPPQPGEVFNAEGPVDEPTWLITWTLPGAYLVHDAVFDMLRYYVWEQARAGLKSVDRELVRGVDVFVAPGIRGTVVTALVEMRAQVSDEDMQEVREAVLRKFNGEMPNAFAAAYKHEWSDEAKSSILTSFMHRIETVASLFGGRGVQLAPVIHNTGDSRHFSTWMEKLGAMTLADFRPLVEGYLKPERLSVVLVTPQDETEIEERGTHYDRRLALVDTASTSGKTKVTAAEVDALAYAPPISTYERAELPNGLTVVAGKNGSLPLVSVGLTADGGAMNSSPALLARRLYAFVRHGKEAQIKRVGGTAYAHPTDTSYHVHAKAPAGNLDTALQAIADHTAAGWVDSERSRFRVSRVTKTYLEVYENLRRSAQVASDRLGTRLYPGHPMQGLPVPLETLEKASPQWAESWWGRVVRPGNATLFIVGDIEPKAAIEAATRVLGQWKPLEVGERVATGGSFPTPPPVVGGGLTLVDNPKATQSTALIGCRLPNWTPASTSAIDVLQEVLNVQLYRSIREQGGATYGIYSYVEQHPSGIATLYLGGKVDGPQTADALKVLLAAVARLEKESVDPKLVVRQVLGMARGYGLSLQTNDAIVDRMVSFTDAGLPIERIESDPRNLAGVTAGDFAAVLQGCSDNLVTVLEGSAEAIAAPLETAGFTILEVLRAPTRDERNAARKKLDDAWEKERRSGVRGWL